MDMVHDFKGTLASISPTQSVGVLYFQTFETQAGTIPKLEERKGKHIEKRKKY